ncbi:MAG TPA: hypothetical protein PLM07_12840 [Candidatus Rifleibacterium sp.]|nr:hypothetical protein [Candidatus Rifleibacterium sp.]HPT46770.1 hypothetical protein [Candidatus Rifleibacterium sp.]
MKKYAFLLFASASLLCGCGGAPEAPKTPAPVAENTTKAPLSKSDALREKAKFAEAASLVGYDGKAIKEDLNKVIDAQEESAKRLEDLNNIR